MTDIVIGSVVGTGAQATINVPTLLRSGMLVQSNSGGGKSWLLRVLAEQLSPLVPVIIIDPEGEFSSLRARFPFVLIGPGGDAPASVAGARLTAERLLKLRSNAVIDLFELKPAEREAFVAAFIETITEAPKELWHDTVVMVDEAHKFAPEKGDSASGDAIATAASVWRKRGKCLIAATQRLAKFHKDAAAELQNKAIGPTFMDIDRERCAEELGVGRADKADFYRVIKAQAPGTFWMIGRAVCQDRTLVRTRAVVSNHPEAGSKRHLDPPPAPEKIRHLLPQLIDLPKEAETKLKTEKDLRVEIARLRAELATAPGRHEMVARISQDAVALAAERDQWREHCRKAEERLNETRQAFDGATPAELRRLRVMESSFNQVIDATASYQDWNREQLAINGRPITNMRPMNNSEEADFEKAPRISDFQPVLNSPPPSDGDGSMRMLRALAARHPTPLTEQQVSVLAGMKKTGGTYRTYRGKLTGQGLVTKDGQFLRITDVGLKAAGPVQRPISGAEMLAVWLPKFSGKARDLLEFFAHNGRLAVTKADALRRVGLDPTGGTARTYWGQLNGCGLLEKTTGGFRAVESLVVR